MLPVRFESRVIHLLDRRMLDEPAGNRQGAFVLLRDPEGERFHAAQQAIRIRGRQRRAIDLAKVIQPLDQCFAPAGRSAQGVRVTAQKLGGAVKHDIRAHRQRISR